MTPDEGETRRFGRVEPLRQAARLDIAPCPGAEQEHEEPRQQREIVRRGEVGRGEAEEPQVRRLRGHAVRAGRGEEDERETEDRQHPRGQRLPESACQAEEQHTACKQMQHAEHDGHVHKIGHERDAEGECHRLCAALEVAAREKSELMPERKMNSPAKK